MSTTAERIKEAMQLRDLRQSDLVEMTGISKGALSSYISGRYVPKQTNIYMLSKALNVSEAWLMGNDVPMERNTSTLSPRDERDVEKKLQHTLDELTNSQEALMFMGNPLDDNTKELLRLSLENSLNIAKVNAKKFTPNKYKKD